MTFYTIKNLQRILRIHKLPYSRPFILSMEATGIIKTENILSYHWEDYQGNAKNVEERVSLLEQRLSEGNLDDSETKQTRALIARMQATNKISPSTEYVRIYSEQDIELIIQQLKDRKLSTQVNKQLTP